VNEGVQHSLAPLAEPPAPTDGIHLTGIVMKTNVGGIDRILRIAFGALLIVLALAGTIGAWGWLGLIPLATGIFRTCPLYQLIGFSSCPMEKR
jgi:O-antigen ligase